MTEIVVQEIATTLAVSAPVPTQLVAALDPPVVLQVAPLGAVLQVRVAQSGMLVAPAAQGPMGPQGDPGPVGPGFGYAYSADSQYTDTSPLAIMSAVPTSLVVDGLGPRSDNTQLRSPFAGWQFWRGGRFYPRDIADGYLLRISFSASSLVIDNVIKLTLDAGGAVGVFYEDRRSFDTVAGEARVFNFEVSLFAGSIFFEDGAAIFIDPLTAPMLLWGASLLVQPLSVGGS